MVTAVPTRLLNPAVGLVDAYAKTCITSLVSPTQLFPRDTLLHRLAEDAESLILVAEEKLNKTGPCIPEPVFRVCGNVANQDTKLKLVSTVHRQVLCHCSHICVQ